MNENDVITRNRFQTTADVVCTIEFEFCRKYRKFCATRPSKLRDKQPLLICRGTEEGHFFGRKRRNYL